MNENALKSIENNLRKVAEQITEFDVESKYKSVMHDGIGYSLPSDSERLFNDIIESILKYNDFQTKFSSKYIEDTIKPIFAEFVKDEKVNLFGLLESMIKKLEDFSECRSVYMQVLGIKINNLCCKFGNVMLMGGDQELLEMLKSKFITINNQTIATKNAQELHQIIIEGKLSLICNIGCIACVNVNAEPLRAKELAIEEVERVIDIINYCSIPIYSFRKTKINVQGFSPKAIRNIISISKDRFNFATDILGADAEFEINSDNLKIIEKINGFKLFDVLCKSNPNKFESSLIQCLHWFSMALAEEEKTNSFLFSIISLESLFKQAQGSSISSTVSEGVAFLLQDEKEKRVELVKKMRGYYGKRSAVSHGGKTVIDDSQLFELFYIVGSVINNLSQKIDVFESQNDLVNWIDEIKFS